MLESYPAIDEFARDGEAEADIDWLKGFVVGVRQIRGEMNLSAGRPLPVQLTGGGELDLTREPDGTTRVTVSVTDQAQLHGVLARLRDLGVFLIDLRRTG